MTLWLWLHGENKELYKKKWDMCYVDKCIYIHGAQGLGPAWPFCQVTSVNHSLSTSCRDPHIRTSLRDRTGLWMSMLPFDFQQFRQERKRVGFVMERKLCTNVHLKTCLDHKCKWSKIKRQILIWIQATSHSSETCRVTQNTLGCRGNWIHLDRSLWKPTVYSLLSCLTAQAATTISCLGTAFGLLWIFHFSCLPHGTLL